MIFSILQTLSTGVELGIGYLVVVSWGPLRISETSLETFYILLTAL